MAHNSDDLRVSPRSDLSVQAFDEVKATSPELPTPTFVANAMSPEILCVKWREWLNGVANEASGCMGVESEHEWNEEMMSVPEGLKRLLTDLLVCGGVHEKHAKEHDMACDASSLCIVDLESGHLSNLRFLNVEEAVFVSEKAMRKVT